MAACAAWSAPIPEGARFCPACGAPVEAPAAAEERKLATVLFADLVASTELAGSQDPERTRATLTAHRIHSVGLLLEVDEWAGNRDAVVALTPRAVAAAEENRATPCGYNSRSLLSCALGAAVSGDDGRATELEEEAETHALEGREGILNPLRIRLALERGELERVRMLLDEIPRETLDLRRIPALAVLGEREQVEAEAPEHVDREAYLRPIALRALGVVRDDRELVEESIAAFEALGLWWYATQTRALL